jgi:ABC-2 type transport system permease protein
VSGRHLRAVLARDVRLGPRSPFVLYSLAIPVVLTLLVQGVFGDLFAPEPRLDIVDDGDSVVSRQASGLEGITVSFVDDQRVMLDRVEANDADAGLYLPAGFDEQVADGSQPELSFYVSGESLASNRIILGVTTLEMIRGIEGTEPPIDVTVEQLGEVGLDISQRVLPLLLMMVVAIAAGFVPAASVVQEREDRTLSALLVSPASMRDILGAKALFGIALALVTGFATLLLNDAVAGKAGAHALILGVAGVMMAEIGLLLGAWAKDSNTLFAAWKGGALLIVFPAVFFLFPELPQWIARIGPTYYFLDPAFRIASQGAGLQDVLGTLLVGAGICVALAPLVVVAGKRLERTVAVA